MRKVVVAAAGLIAAIGLAAGPAGAVARGTVTLQGTAHAGQEATVRVAITNGTPITAYEYQIENSCALKKGFSSFETYALGGPWFQGDDGIPYTDVVINLNDVPAGATCKASLAHGPSLVKGATATFIVQP